MMTFTEEECYALNCDLLSVRYPTTWHHFLAALELRNLGQLAEVQAHSALQGHPP